MANKRHTKKAPARRRHARTSRPDRTPPNVPAMLRREVDRDMLEGMTGRDRTQASAARTEPTSSAAPVMVSLACSTEINVSNLNTLVARLDSFLCRVGRARPPRECKPEPTRGGALAELPHLQRIATGIGEVGAGLSNLADVVSMLEEIG